ncbi:uncharacterized protein K02A2.6-like isoform X2 [Photinus pyralis]|nr:uncharacterized protein K02A2.6-like isoform X2 [Photinus pyralis]
MLRDRIVCGIIDETLQKRLLATTDLKLADVTKMCVAHETATTSFAMIREGGSGDRVEVNALNSRKQVKSADRASRPGRVGKKCFRCEKDHAADSCVHSQSTCSYCKKLGHIAIACFKKKRESQNKLKVHIANDSDPYTEEPEISPDPNCVNSDYVFSINNVTPDKFSGKYLTAVSVNGIQTKMEVDSGAGYSIIGRSLFQKISNGNHLKLKKSHVILRDYQNNPIPTVGECLVEVRRGSRRSTLPLIITEGNRPSLLGRNWFQELGLTVSGVSHVDGTPNYAREYPEVFCGNLGAYRGPPVSFSVDASVKPILLRARKVPFALKDKIERELDKLISQGVLEPISYPRWGTPIVTVCKGNGEVRICGDYRSTLNRALRPEPYPVPSVQGILSALAGGKVFAKLDLAQAYLQLSVDREAAEAQTIITHKGVFKCNRLQFGISVAPQIFQKFMDMRLAGISGVLPYYDDILVVGSSDDDLDTKVRTVLSKFREDGLQLRREKCIFRTKSIEFLGFRISEDGIRPTKDKIAAIVNAPPPTNVTELQAFLGLVNFYHVFMKDKATIAKPLHALLQKNAQWQWRTSEREAFQALKDCLIREPVLAHYNDRRNLFLTCDASPYGVGCVLSQLDDRGRDVPVAYHSRSLSSAERKYAQIDKEALTIITGVKKFHEYIYGRGVTITTDHKPLLGVFNPKKGVPDILSPRMLRWTLMLSAYDYELRYVPGAKIQNADALSRLPQKIKVPEPPPSEDVLMLENIPEKLISAREIAQETKRDPVLSRVMQWIWKGWPDNGKKLPDEFTPYLQRKHELNCYQDCLLWGTRVIVPLGVRDTVLKMLHSAHPGIVKMKSLARSYVWWPNIDKQIEKLVGLCRECQETRNMPRKSSIHPWEWARAPWSRIHIDHAGPMKGKLFLVVTDAYSKWLEVKLVPNTSSAVTIGVLRELFATHGIPDVVVSDNGTSFSSSEFKQFLKNNMIRQALVAPYHPSSNGQAERMVQNVKNAIRKMTEGTAEGNLQLVLSRYLLAQHITPHCTTGRSPAEILMGRKLNTVYDRMQPDFRKEMMAKQEDKVIHTRIKMAASTSREYYGTRQLPGTNTRWANITPPFRPN